MTRAIVCLFVLGVSSFARADWSDFAAADRCLASAEALRGDSAKSWPKEELMNVAHRCATSPAALTTLAELFCSRRDYVTARALLDEAERLPGATKLARYQFWRGYVLAWSGEYAASLAAYRRAKMIGNPTGGATGLPIDAWLIEYNAADDLMALGRLEEAATTYRRAIRLSDSRAVHLALAVALDRLGDVDAATVELNTAVRGERRAELIWPPYMVLFPAEEEHVYRALLFHHLGRLKDAVDELQRFVQTGGASPYVQHAQMRLVGWQN